jgi:Domain of unknown function DUF29
MREGLHAMDMDILLWSERQAEALRRLAERQPDAGVDWPRVVEAVEGAGRAVLHEAEAEVARALYWHLMLAAHPGAANRREWRAAAEAGPAREPRPPGGRGRGPHRPASALRTSRAGGPPAGADRRRGAGAAGRRVPDLAGRMDRRGPRHRGRAPAPPGLRPACPVAVPPAGWVGRRPARRRAWVTPSAALRPCAPRGPRHAGRGGAGAARLGGGACAVGGRTTRGGQRTHRTAPPPPCTPQRGTGASHAKQEARNPAAVGSVRGGLAQRTGGGRGHIRVRRSPAQTGPTWCR